MYPCLLPLQLDYKARLHGHSGGLGWDVDRSQSQACISVVPRQADSVGWDGVGGRLPLPPLHSSHWELSAMLVFLPSWRKVISP